jgi:uncharacterized membrane protein
MSVGNAHVPQAKVIDDISLPPRRGNGGSQAPREWKVLRCTLTLRAGEVIDMRSIRSQQALLIAGTTLLIVSCGDSGGGSAPDCPENSTLTYESFGKGFVDEYCADCHAASVTGTARQGAPKGDVFDSLTQIQAKSDELIDEVVIEKAMPYKTYDHQPSNDERDKFGEWLACGAPE